MAHRCLPDVTLAEFGALPIDDPRRADAQGCPRCAARLAALNAFLAGDPDLPAIDATAADRALADFVSRLPPTARTPHPARARRWFAPRRLLPLASACAAVALAVLLVRHAGDPVPIGARLRGAAPAAAPASIVIHRTGPAADGSFDLTWSPVAGADHYTVELFSGDLDTLAVLSPLLRPTAHLALEILQGQDAASGVLVRVRALAGDRALAVSPLRTVTEQ